MNTISIKAREIERVEKRGFVTDYPSEDRVKESADFSLRFTNVKDRVASILRTDKFARRNDLWLCILYWVKMGQIKIIVPMEDFTKANDPETISRARRKLVEEAKNGAEELKFLLDEKINEMRETRAMTMSNYFSQENYRDKVNIVK